MSLERFIHALIDQWPVALITFLAVFGLPGVVTVLARHVRSKKA